MPKDGLPMFKWYKHIALLAALLPSAVLADRFDNLGVPATEHDLRLWDTNIRADYQGLPPGSGTVESGRVLYEQRCQSCHGATGTEVIVFSPLVGGTTASDVRNGKVAAFEPPIKVPVSTLMRLPTLATLIDYIGRAMPWDSPKSLTADEVYALTAYILYLGDLVDEDFSLSAENAALTGQRLPNRGGFTTDHGLWPGEASDKGGMGNGLIPDITPARCMTDCNPRSTQ
jgi:mono/diheme cytochrome c family protein